MMTLAIELAGERVLLDARRALVWPREGALLIADLHLGKASLMRQAGAALPRGTTTADLERLSTLVADYRPQHLLVLGDLTHGAETVDAPWLVRFAEWRHAHAALEITLVAGNHDRHMTLPDLGITVVPQLDMAPFHLCHAPALHAQLHVVAGHLHPAARFRDGRMAQRWPAFWIGDQRSVLPAFGSLTGLSPSSPDQIDCVYAVTPGGILALRPVDSATQR